MGADVRAVAMRRAVIAAGVGLVVTALIIMTPYVVFGVRSPAGHLLLNSLDAFIALLVAFLVHGRYLRSHRLQDLLLSQGLVFLAVAGLGLIHLTRLLPARSGTLEVWLPLSIRLPGAVLIAAAALAGDRSWAPARRHRYPLVPLAATLALAAGLLWFNRSDLPVALDVNGPKADAQHPLLEGHPVLLLAQVVAAVCFAVAAVLFTRQAVQSRDELLGWIGPAFVLGAFARIHYLLFPSVYTDWLYSGDLLRTGSHVLMLIGAVREIQQFWNAQTDIAVLEDRRRLARELHDGLVQEIAYIKLASHAIPSTLSSRGEILAACDRALDEARGAVHALGSESDEPLGDTLQRAVRQLAERYDVTVDFLIAESIPVTSDQRHALVRIAREAVNNACRHGHARTIRLSLENTQSGRVLVICDDGSGFEVRDAADPGRASDGNGFGLVSMRERARELPGTLTVRSAPSRGTEVAVQW